MGHHNRRTRCRGCDGPDLSRFLELGEQPLANAFLRSSKDVAGETRYPLDVYFCHECGLVQLLDVIDPDILFSDYIYTTGTSETMAAHNAQLALKVVESMGLGPDDLVVEAASNDGSLLSKFRALGVRTLGVEPATNIAKIAQAAGIETVNQFFTREVGREIRSERGSARVVICNNVLAHVDDPVDFLAGAEALLSDDGRIVVEVPYLGDLVDRLEYDTIYHEHLSYFSLAALTHIFARAGLAVVGVDRVPVHGGSLRVWGARGDTHSVEVELEVEASRGLRSWDLFRGFGQRVEAQRRALRDLLMRSMDKGLTIAAYGAPAKGNTLLNYCGIGPDILPFTVDRSPLKVGLLTPGTHIPVRPVQELLDRRPDYTLVLAWNFADEVKRQQQAYFDAGGRFILPLPEPKILA